MDRCTNENECWIQWFIPIPSYLPIFPADVFQKSFAWMRLLFLSTAPNWKSFLVVLRACKISNTIFSQMLSIVICRISNICHCCNFSQNMWHLFWHIFFFFGAILTSWFGGYCVKTSIFIIVGNISREFILEPSKLLRTKESEEFRNSSFGFGSFVAWKDWIYTLNKLHSTLGLLIKNIVKSLPWSPNHIKNSQDKRSIRKTTMVTTTSSPNVHSSVACVGLEVFAVLCI